MYTYLVSYLKQNVYAICWPQTACWFLMSTIDVMLPVYYFYPFSEIQKKKKINILMSQNLNPTMYYVPCFKRRLIKMIG